MNGERTAAVAREGYPHPVRRPVWSEVDPRLGGQTPFTGAIRIDHIDVPVPVSYRPEGDLGCVRRPHGIQAVEGVERELAAAGAVSVHHPDLLHRNRPR